MFIFILCYFALILAFSFLRTKKIENKSVNLFKFMFPAWKFFDESTDTPVLLYRLDDLDNWKICFPPPKTSWYKLIYNPENNLYLAYHSHIQQVLGELTECPESELPSFHQRLSYKMLEYFVREHTGSKDFYFKLSKIKMKSESEFDVLEDILLSPKIAGVIP